MVYSLVKAQLFGLFSRGVLPNSNLLSKPLPGSIIVCFEQLLGPPDHSIAQLGFPAPLWFV